MDFERTPSLSFDAVTLPEEGMDWLMRPWAEGKCEMRHLKDGTYTIDDVALMNEVLDARAENEVRAAKVAEANARRH